MLLVDDLAAGGTKNLRHTPRGLVTLYSALFPVPQTPCEIMCGFRGGGGGWGWGAGGLDAP